MTCRFLFLALAACVIPAFAYSQDAVNYQLPPKVMEELLLAQPTPGVSVDNKGEWMLLSERSTYPSVEELARPELRIAGIRINPDNFGPSRATYVTGLSLKNIRTGQEMKIKGLPQPLQASFITWSPEETKIAFTHTTSDRIDLYLVDIATQTAKKYNQHALNAVLGTPYVWISEKILIYKSRIQDAKMPPRPLMPKGPAVQQSLGKTAPNRTYQDLIKSAYDEELFEFMATSQLTRVQDGIELRIGTQAVYSSVALSPDKNYFLTGMIQKPYSYLVPYTGFPIHYVVADLNNRPVRLIARNPSSEGVMTGYDNVPNMPRGISWRLDMPATVVFTVPLDSGIMKKDVPFHDAVYQQAAPFQEDPTLMFQTRARYYGISWGDANLALVSEGSQAKHTVTTYRFSPSTGKMDSLMTLSTDDAYGDPGDPVTRKNSYNQYVIYSPDQNTILMNNRSGSTPSGDLPFLASYDLKTRSSKVLWRCPAGQYEYVVNVLDPQKQILLTRMEKQTLIPNYFIRDLKKKSSTPITQFENPYPALEGVQKNKISYKRADGVDLTGQLYLPKGYEPARDGKLPVLIWAYPREFKSAADAAQVRGSQHTFTRISGGSPVFWVTQGYAVLDEAEMPIVGEGDKEPNDNFIDQLRQNAEAAINELSRLGVGDPNRVAVGGHSYGAFMTANLLAHTKLFKAGIARSGAYNRTLTPFGFQNETRTYWEAPEVYNTMSPFSHADKIKTPLLLIHGEADNNSGTFPIQSERLFNAIKGHGGTVRYVALPHESHGYNGKENLLHMLWEMNTWLDRYVKNAPAQ